MTKFIVRYLAPIDAAWKTAESSPEDMKKSMEAWMAWAQKCGEKLVDMGSPIGNGIHHARLSYMKACLYQEIRKNNKLIIL